MKPLKQLSPKPSEYREYSTALGLIRIHDESAWRGGFVLTVSNFGEEPKELPNRPMFDSFEQATEFVQAIHKAKMQQLIEQSDEDDFIYEFQEIIVKHENP